MFTGLVLGSRELYGTLYHATVYTAPMRRPATSTTQHTTRVTRAAIVALVGIYFTTMPSATSSELTGGITHALAMAVVPIQSMTHIALMIHL